MYLFCDGQLQRMILTECHLFVRRYWVMNERLYPLCLQPLHQLLAVAGADGKDIENMLAWIAGNRGLYDERIVDARDITCRDVTTAFVVCIQARQFHVKGCCLQFIRA